MKVMLDSWGILPTRAHETDAGLDIYSPCDAIVRAGSSMVFQTGVHVAIPSCCAGVLISKSGLNVKHNITSTGLIDEGYTGQIAVKLYNHGAYDYKVSRGDKISQLVIIPVFHPVIELVDELEETERGNGGFGSTGR